MMLSLRHLLLAFLFVHALDAASLWSLDGWPSRSGHGRAVAERPFTGSLRDRLVQAIWPSSKFGLEALEADGKPVTATLPEHMLKRYGSDKVLRFEIDNDNQRQAIAEITDALFLDVWGMTKTWIDIRLSKESMDNVFKLLPGDIRWRPIVHHLASAVFQSQNEEDGDEKEVDFVSLSKDESLPGTMPRGHVSTRTNVFFQKYQPLSVIVPWMRLLRSLFPTHVRLIDVGTSYEGRAISAIRVGNHPQGIKSKEPRKVIIVAGGLHAREWIGTSTVTYAAYELITGYGKSRQVTKLIEEFDFIFIPTLNPDGYAYTWEEDRLWRKNRQSTKFDFCPGVDLDRSFGFQWHGENTQGNPCSESYAGEGPFDAHEAGQFAEWVKNRTESGADRIVGFFDLHSYSQQILYPYSYTCESAPSSWEDLQEVGLGLEKAMYTATNKRYTTTSACEGGSTLWPREVNGGGSLLDWIMSQGVTYSYQLKLRDTGSYGFLLPAKEIVPTGKEVYAAIKYFAQHLLDSASVMTYQESPSTHEPAFTHGSQAGHQATLIQADQEDSEHLVSELKR